MTGSRGLVVLGVALIVCGVVWGLSGERDEDDELEEEETRA